MFKTFLEILNFWSDGFSFYTLNNFKFFFTDPVEYYTFISLGILSFLSFQIWFTKVKNQIQRFWTRHWFRQGAQHPVALNNFRSISPFSKEYLPESFKMYKIYLQISYHFIIYYSLFLALFSKSFFVFLSFSPFSSVIIKLCKILSSLLFLIYLNFLC